MSNFRFRSFPDFLLFLGMASSSVYIFDSGGLQPSDLVMIIFSVLSFAKIVFGGGLSSYGKSTPISYLLFTLVIFCVSTIRSIQYSDQEFLKFLSYWVYNFFVVTTIMASIRCRVVSINSLYYGIYTALLISAAYILISYGDSRRASALFNNPNQLAEFSLSALAIVMYANRFKFTTDLKFIVVFFSAIIGILASASLAAWLGLLMVLAGIVYYNIKSFRMVFVFFISFVSLVGVSVISSEVTYKIAENAIYRIGLIDKKVNEANEIRRIDRVYKYPEYILFGAGEARKFERFYDDVEITNAYLNVLFNYGILGFIAFLYIISVSIFKDYPYSAFAIFGPLVYNTTHMGLRSTLFWMLVLLIWNSSFIKERAAVKVK